MRVQLSPKKTIGSTNFEGNAKVSGSAEDYGFLKVDSVTVHCTETRYLTAS